MKRLYSIIAILTLSISLSNAQPSVKKYGKSVFTLTTFDKDGNIKSSDIYGVFVGSEGEAISLWTPFIDTDSAIVKTSNGDIMEVESIIGANELYNVCKFKVKGKTSSIEIARKPSTQGENMWVLFNKNNKLGASKCEIDKTEAFMDKYTYYIISMEDAPEFSGCPVIDKDGKLTGLFQRSGSSAVLNVVDANFTDSIETKGLFISNSMYRQTGIKLYMPADKQEALIMLVMAKEQCDSSKYVKYVDDFISSFPTEVNGYSTRAMNLVSAGHFEEADKTMKAAIEKTADKAAAHAEYSSVIYQKLIYSPDTTYKEWTLDKALGKIRKAYEMSPQPVYRHREAQIIYTKGDYQKAYDMFIGLTKEELKREELFLEAAQCKIQLNAPDTEVVVLLDSAVSACPKPLTSISSPYILARGQIYDKMGEYRKALADYNVYDTLMLGNADAPFYYTRFKCELNIKQYKQALNDIAHAAYLNPNEPVYLAEMSSLQLRLNQLDDAIKSADLCIRIAPEFPDAYLIKGLALIHKKDKSNGLQMLEKARGLGDSRAQELIDKYK